MQQHVTFVEKQILRKLAKDKNYQKARDNCHFTGKYRDTEHSVCSLRFDVPNQIPVVFHNRSNYDYHFIIKELANKFEGKIACFRKVLEEYKLFQF